MWRVEMLGGLRVWCGERCVQQFRTRKVAALLALLALEPGRNHTRESLADTLWPDEAIETSRRRLRQALSLLRSELAQLGEPPLVQESRELLRLDAHVETDVRAFEQARVAGEMQKALALYQGVLLPGFFEEPFEGPRERLEAHHRSLLSWHAERKRRPSVPLPLTPLFGRDALKAQLIAQLGSRQTRLVTLLGPGGIGKTRLALDTAWGLSDAFLGAVCFVSLVAVSSPEGIAIAALDALREPGDEPERSSQPPLERLLQRLLELPTALLVLDNCEHLPGVALPVRRLLEHVPGLSLLTTSRQVLGIAGEHRIEVPPLDKEAARAWFLFQAQASRADLSLTEPSQSAVEEIVVRLDGVPLALELAATWSSALTPREIAQQLAHSQDLLVRRDSAGDPRHTTLKDTIAASFASLPAELRSFWLSLSVFRGGWQREASEAICKPVGQGSVAALASLRDRSLVTASENADGLRWSLLAPLREFAETSLSPSDSQALRARHCDYYLVFADHAADVVHQQDRTLAFALLERDEANILAALHYGLGAEPSLVLRSLGLLRRLSWHWWVRGRSHNHSLFKDAIQHLRARITEFEGDGLGMVLRTLAEVATSPQEAEPLYRQALAVHEQTGNLRLRAEVSQNLAELLISQTRYPEALALAETLIGEYEALQEWQEVSYWLGYQAGWHQSDGEYAQAFRLYQRAHGLNERVGLVGWNRKLAIDLAPTLCAIGQSNEAESQLRQAAAWFAETGEIWNHADALTTLGEVLHHQGQRPEAKRVFEESLHLWLSLRSQPKIEATRAKIQELEKKSAL